ncbi:hypothetical protein ACHAQA_005203 [Verticillium albo-atrum]
MSSTTTNPAKSSGSKTPELPPNVIIFSPANPSAAEALLNGRIFTRLTTTTSTTPAQLLAAVKNIAKTEIREEFCLPYRNGILIYDGVDAEQDDADLQDLHHEHFRLACLALKDADIDLDVSGCVFDARSILQAGFQLDTLSPGTVLVIDLMDNDDDDEDDEDEDDETTEAKLGALMGGGFGAMAS